MGKGKRVSVEDFISILNLMGEYQFMVDEGDEEGWASLFVEDGFFLGLPIPFEGREALKIIPRTTGEYGGKMRHLSGNHTMHYGETTDEVYDRFYSLVTTWVKGAGPQFYQMAICEAHLVRVDGEWKLKSNTINMLNEDM